jgi:hypothetical protein
MLFDRIEDRDGLLEHGGESGMNESYARLAQLLARPASAEGEPVS